MTMIPIVLGSSDFIKPINTNASENANAATSVASGEETNNTKHSPNQLRFRSKSKRKRSSTTTTTTLIPMIVGSSDATIATIVSVASLSDGETKKTAQTETVSTRTRQRHKTKQNKTQQPFPAILCAAPVAIGEETETAQHQLQKEIRKLVAIAFDQTEAAMLRVTDLAQARESTTQERQVQQQQKGGGGGVAAPPKQSSRPVTVGVSACVAIAFDQIEASMLQEANLAQARESTTQERQEQPSSSVTGIVSASDSLLHQTIAISSSIKLAAMADLARKRGSQALDNQTEATLLEDELVMARVLQDCQEQHTAEDSQGQCVAPQLLQQHPQQLLQHQIFQQQLLQQQFLQEQQLRQYPLQQQQLQQQQLLQQRLTRLRQQPLQQLALRSDVSSPTDASLLHMFATNKTTNTTRHPANTIGISISNNRTLAPTAIADADAALKQRELRERQEQHNNADINSQGHCDAPYPVLRQPSIPIHVPPQPQPQPILPKVPPGVVSLANIPAHGTKKLLLRSKAREDRERLFLSRLRYVLDDPSLDDVLSWKPDGRAFTIVAPKTFTSAGTLRELFGLRTMSSFLRRLYQLGFVRVRDLSDPVNVDVFRKPGFVMESRSSSFVPMSYQTDQKAAAPPNTMAVDVDVDVAAATMYAKEIQYKPGPKRRGKGRHKAGSDVVIPLGFRRMPSGIYVPVGESLGVPRWRQSNGSSKRKVQHIDQQCHPLSYTPHIKNTIDLTADATTKPN